MDLFLCSHSVEKDKGSAHSAK